MNVVDAAFAPLSSSAPVSHASARRSRGRDLAVVGRRLWQAVILAAVLNVILVVALLMTRGELPGVWDAGESIRPGTSVRIAGAGLVARASPDTSRPSSPTCRTAGRCRSAASRSKATRGLWWPVEVDTATGAVNGYVPESWVQAP